MQKKILFIFPKRKAKKISIQPPVIQTEIPKNVEAMKSNFTSSYLEDTSIPIKEMDMTTLIIIPTVVIFFLIILTQKK